MRRLLYIPVIHSQVDMGSMAGDLKERYLKAYGPERWRQHEQAVDQMWSGIERRIGERHLDHGKTTLYQDGLPVCGKEMEIAREVASRGSRNYQLLLELVKKGASLVGTEDPKLLVEEYRYLKSQMEKPPGTLRWWRMIRDRIHARRLLAQRDRFIAQRINESLSDGRTGLLFIGIEHAVDRYLPREIEISYLFFRLPFRHRGALEALR